ncbi:hypothetical protein AM493_05695 [Flavobacterium akiainvivens]|uniref:HTH luxR-type domain-containing protein n=2 Tax=Flavobacterium akiainvivens TaxID=1202724 RepID=A0A0M9VHR4_9FLAO|nr:hypothetical protein AM493_05695 [Flavobacterium akiainvivens]
MVSAQVLPESKSLEERVLHNRKLIFTEPEAYLKNLDVLMGLALKQHNRDAELELLAQRYNYYYFSEADFEHMLDAAQKLLRKSLDYNSFLYEAVAHKYMAQTYLFNGLYSRSGADLQKALDALDKLNATDKEVIQEKAKVYTAFSNLFTQTKEYPKSIQYLRFALLEHQKLKDTELKRGTSYMDYANLAGAYLEVNIDSAEYYAHKSNSLRKVSESSHELTFLNYIVLGKVYLQRKNYSEALSHFKKAETIEENKNFLNVQELYESLIKTYNGLGDANQANVYKRKLDQYKLSISENKNKSLVKLLDEKNKEDAKGSLFPYGIVISASGALALIILSVYFIRKGKKKQKVTITPERYEELVKLSGENSQAFILAFDQTYPDFTKRILDINPGITHDELELLAMIKLNLSSKEISAIKFVQPKTVQNRRHLARKKLGLSTSDNLYKWVEAL